MTTFIILVLAGLAIFSVFGMALLGAMLCGKVAGGVIQWAMQADQPQAGDDDRLTARELAKIDKQIRRARKAAGLPPRPRLP